MGTAEGCFRVATNHPTNRINQALASSLNNSFLGDGITLEASRSSSLYKNNASVKPKSLKTLPLIRL